MTGKCPFCGRSSGVHWVVVSRLVNKHCRVGKAANIRAARLLVEKATTTLADRPRAMACLWFAESFLGGKVEPGPGDCPCGLPPRVRMLYEQPPCTHCGSADSRRFGTRKTPKGIIRMYMCVSCKRAFRTPEDRQFHHISDKQKSRIIDLFRNGMTAKAIARMMKKEGTPVSAGTVGRWAKGTRPPMMRQHPKDNRLATCTHCDNPGNTRYRMRRRAHDVTRAYRCRKCGREFTPDNKQSRVGVANILMRVREMVRNGVPSQEAIALVDVERVLQSHLPGVATARGPAVVLPKHVGERKDEYCGRCACGNITGGGYGSCQKCNNQEKRLKARPRQCLLCRESRKRRSPLCEACRKVSVVDVNRRNRLGSAKGGRVPASRTRPTGCLVRVAPVKTKTKPKAKPPTRLAGKAKGKPKTEPSTKPSGKPSTKPSTKPKAKPKAKPTVKPKVKPSTKPPTKPKAKPPAKPKAKPAAKPSTKPSTKPAGKPPTKPKAKPTPEQLPETIQPEQPPRPDPPPIPPQPVQVPDPSPPKPTRQPHKCDNHDWCLRHQFVHGRSPGAYMPYCWDCEGYFDTGSQLKRVCPCCGRRV